MPPLKKQLINFWKRFPIFFGIILFLTTFYGCATIHKRNPVPEEKVSIAKISGIQFCRMWGDTLPEDFDSRLAHAKAQIENNNPAMLNISHNYLAISGGGSDGAFGAGVLVGWTASGNRPTFQMVTGISTGALIAPFAFLGSAYDAQLQEAYTTISTKDILKKRRPLKILTGDAAVDSKPFKQLIAKYITPSMLKEIAGEYMKGRRLYIGTTNLDAKRPVIWNIGAIASSGHPDAIKLVRSVMLASASIPGIFPPVYIEVEADGHRYDEIHVDGGTASQVFLYPGKIDYAYAKRKVGITLKGRVFIIRNSRLQTDWEMVSPKIGSIAKESILTLIMTQGTGDLYRIFFGTQRDGIEYNLAYIPETFKVEHKEPFDRKYMNKLFDLGYDLAIRGYPWDKSPPGFFSITDKK